MRRTVLAALCLAVVSATSGCAIWGPEGGPGGAGMKRPAFMSTTAPAGVDSVDAVQGTDGVQRATVTMTDGLRFTPSTVRAQPGTVEITFVNAGATAHDVAVADVGVASRTGTGNVNGGQRGTATVTVTVPGRYPYPCLYHASSGMTGNLIIS